MKLAIVKFSDLTIVSNGVSSQFEVPEGASPAAATQVDATFASAPTLSSSTDYLLMAIHNDADWSVYITYDAGETNFTYIDTTNSFSSPTDPTDAVIGAGDSSTDFVANNNKFSIWVTYTPAASPSSTNARRALLGVGV